MNRYIYIYLNLYLSVYLYIHYKDSCWLWYREAAVLPLCFKGALACAWERPEVSGL